MHGNGHYRYLQTQFGEDRCMQFRVIMVTDPQTNKETHKQTHIQDRLQYTAPQLARSVKIIHTRRATTTSANRVKLPVMGCFKLLIFKLIDRRLQVAASLIWITVTVRQHTLSRRAVTSPAKVRAHPRLWDVMYCPPSIHRREGREIYCNDFVRRVPHDYGVKDGSIGFYEGGL